MVTLAEASSCSAAPVVVTVFYVRLFIHWCILCSLVVQIGDRVLNDDNLKAFDVGISDGTLLELGKLHFYRLLRALPARVDADVARYSTFICSVFNFDQFVLPTCC